jgi:hypothetical protein
MKKTSLFTIISLCMAVWLIAGCAPVVESSTVTGTITQVEQGKDGKQITIETANVFYTTAVSLISDTIINGTMDDIDVGTTVIVSVDEVAGDILIGNSIEIIK